MYIDAHAHIDRHFFGDDLPGVIERFRAGGVDWVVTVGSSADPAVVREAIDVADSNPDVVAAIGVHPHEADAFNDALLDGLARLASNPVVRAIGEIGLDFHYDLSSRRGQMSAFARQLDLASAIGLPVVIHTREAFRESIDVVSSWVRPSLPGQVHCFTGTVDEVRAWLDLGFMVSIPGVVTFRNTDALADAVRYIPDDRLLIETDSPYLAPVPMRGRTNEPAFVSYTAAAVARIRGVPVEHVARVTSINAVNLFKLE